MKSFFCLVVIFVAVSICDNSCIKQQKGEQSLPVVNGNNYNGVVLDLLYADPDNQNIGICWLSFGNIL